MDGSAFTSTDRSPDRHSLIATVALLATLASIAVLATDATGRVTGSRGPDLLIGNDDLDVGAVRVHRAHLARTQKPNALSVGRVFSADYGVGELG